MNKKQRLVPWDVSLKLDFLSHLAFYNLPAMPSGIPNLASICWLFHLLLLPALPLPQIFAKVRSSHHSCINSNVTFQKTCTNSHLTQVIALAILYHMAVSPSSELISAAETSYLFECLQSTSLQEYRLLEDSGFALFAPVSPTLGTMPKTYNCFLSSWEVSVLMSVFQTRQHCHEETEIRRAKSFVQDHIVMSSRPLLGQDGFFKIHLLAACWLSIKIILLLLGRGCWEVLWRIQAGIKCQSMRLEPLRITRKLSHTFTVSLFSCVQTYFESSPCLQALGWLVPEGPGYRCCCSCQPSNTHTAFASAGLDKHE